MESRECKRSALGLLGLGLAAAGAGYAAYAAYAWRRFGKPRPPTPEQSDDLLESFVPTYDVVERHQIVVEAPAELTLAAAEEQDLNASLAVRGIVWLRGLVMGAKQPARELPKGLVAQVEALGWGVLARVPGREVVLGAVTKPWEPDVVFKALPPAEFAAYNEPGFVKIAWTLRADPLGETQSIFRTETRAVCTSDDARVKFRRYWACVAPGVELMRLLTLGPVKREAERRAAEPELEVVL
jgi:hypothetical protein